MTTPSRLLGLAFVVGTFVLAAVFYPSLPDPMPTHWNARGIVDGFSPKPWGPLILPIATAVLWAVFAALPAVSPRGFRLEPFMRVYEIVVVVVVAFMFVLNAVALLAASGRPVDLPRTLTIAMGALMATLGNFMGKMTRNFFVGIRTPWTLASDEVWLRTHRFGAKLFVAVGLLTIAAGVAGVSGPGWIVGPVAVAAVLSVVYSYVVYRRLEGFGAP
jgi:immunity protein, SdpI family